MSVWMATMERLFPAAAWVSRADFLRVAIVLIAALYLVQALLFWPRFTSLLVRAFLAVYAAFVVSSLFFPMPASRACVEALIARGLTYPIELVPFADAPGPAEALGVWVRADGMQLLLFVPLGALLALAHPKRGMAVWACAGFAACGALMGVQAMVCGALGATYMRIATLRALSWWVGLALGAGVVCAARHVARARKRARAGDGNETAVDGT